jgi:hypothetical protein
MHSTSSRFACTLLAAATLAVSAATEPTLAAPPIPDEALEEAAASRKPMIPLFQEPDVAFDLLIGQQCPADEVLNALRNALADRDEEAREYHRRHFPDAPPLPEGDLNVPPADVRLKCANSRLRIGFFPGGIPTSAGLARARDAGLARVDLITSRPQDADRVALGAIRVRPEMTELLELRTGAFLREEKQTETLRFSTFGANAPHVRFVAPNTIVTTVKGKDTRPFPDVSLTTTVTDTLSVNEDTFSCTTRSHTNANTRVHKALFAASILTAPANLGIPAAGFGAQLGLIGREVAAQNRKPADRGPGCQLLDKAFPAGVTLQDGSTVVFRYVQAVVADGALVARFNPVRSPTG